MKETVFAEDLEVGQWARVGDDLIQMLRDSRGDTEPFHRVMDIRSFPTSEVLAIRWEDADGNQSIRNVNRLLAMEIMTVSPLEGDLL